MSDADRTPRPRRNISGRNSTRSSGIYDARFGHGYAQAPSGYTGQPQAGHHGGHGNDSQRGLRPMDSRFSLNEHFAATRKEYEFGDDDCVSVFGGRSVSMASRVQEEQATEGEVGDHDAMVLDDAGDDEGGEEDDANFYEILCVSKEKLTTEEVRGAYFRWFELLYPPSREEDEARAYFMRVQQAFETLVDERRRSEYDSSLGYSSPLESGVEVVSDIAIRVDASGGRRKPRPVDFMLGHAVSFEVSSIGNAIGERIGDARRLMSRMKGPDGKTALENPGKGNTIIIASPPMVTVSGYTYGLADAASPATVNEGYHPLLHTLPRHKSQLLRNLCPLATINLRQNLLAKDPTSEGARSSGFVEIESNLLPSATLTTRVSRTSIVRGSPTSLGVGLTADRLLPRRPQLSLAATQILGSGVAFARVDSGHWRVHADETCRFLPEFSRLNKRLLFRGVGPQAASFEVGYTQGIPGKTVHRHDTLDILRGERVVLNPTASSWTVSLGGTADCLLSSLRYAMNVSRTRLEVELCANSRANHHVAIRNLFALGSSRSSMGLEVSLSPRALHLSLSFARLNQRFSLPVYMVPLPRTLFVAAAVPLLLSAGLTFLRRKPLANQPRKRSSKRREADALAFLLHRSLSRQPEPGKNEVTVLSAKYGAVEDGWAGEDVADVTIALSALVRDGALQIPAGLRTSCLPGFWDPAPGRKKVLRVKFKAAGQEGVAEAKEGEGLTIP